MSRPTLCLVTLAVALVAGLSGCTHTVRVGSGQGVEIGLLEYRLSPDSVRVPAGLVALHVHNYGRLTHNLAVQQGGTTLGATPSIPPGDSVWLWVTLSPGRYSLASTLFEDRDLGMAGTLSVSR